MTPLQPRKRKSDAMDEEPRGVTPTGSPTVKKMRITQSQKQALIDNLQLEITARARHLRAHYALQCADLRARIERRVNRIPLATRKMTMGELAAKHAPQRSHVKSPAQPPTTIYSQVTKTAPTNERRLPAIPQSQSPSKAPSPLKQTHTLHNNNRKRKSSAIQIASDKENDTVVTESQPLPKNNKRAKPHATRATSRSQAAGAGGASSVLSPRSHNSRTLPRSPIKDMQPPNSPTKPFISRPMSPLKPSSPFKSAATAATSAISASVHGMIEHAKRGTNATAGKLSRTASREKTNANPSAGSENPTLTASVAGLRGKMLPPPRPTTAMANPIRPISSPQRTFSQASNHSATSDISTTSSATTVVKTKSKRVGRPPAAVGVKNTNTTKVSNTTTKTRGPAQSTVTVSVQTTVARTTQTPTMELEESLVLVDDQDQDQVQKPAVPVKRGAATKAVSAAKTALKKSAATNKKVILAEPATGRRVLRKRT